uniref:Pheromone binding protein 3 n=1 Tax=Conopomorpha sinensis TaxID=940481 RepID=A0A2Z4EEL7_9NEOP|nr:pheromone binding protein 3 [Conopomorpha sinensis]
MVRNVMLLVGLVALVSTGVQATQEMMEVLTKKYMNAISECKKEMEIADSELIEFINFWRSEEKLVNRHIGCVMMCLSTKLDLVDPSGNLHHGNAREFGKKHGADDELITKLIDMIHSCEKAAPPNNGMCMNILNVANCFRGKIHNLKWAPDIEILIGEVLSEAKR